MARRHTQLAKSRVLQYTEVSSNKIPSGSTVYNVSSLPGTVDLTKEFILVTSTNKYYRITAKEPVQYSSGIAESGLLIGEPAINVASGYESIFVHTYSPSDSSTTNNGLSVYKPITQTITLNTGSMYTPTAQAVSDFVVPKYDSITYTTSTPSITMNENEVYLCTNAGVTSLTLDITNMVTGPKTRESAVYFHTGTAPSLTITGKSGTYVFGDENLVDNKNYKISVKDNCITITPFVGNLAAVATSGSYNDLSDKPTIPSAQVNSDWNSNSGFSEILNKPLNGKNIELKPIVPSDYTLINWAANDTNTYLDTGIVPDVDDIEIEMVVEPTLGSWYILQSRPSGGDTSTVIGISGSSSDNSITFNFCGVSVKSDITRATTSAFTVKAKAKNGTMTLYVKRHSNGLYDTQTDTYTYTSQTLPLYLFGNQNANRVAKGNYIYSLKIWKGGVLVLDYIPVFENTVQEVVYFYNTRTETYKTADDGSLYKSGIEPVKETPQSINCTLNPITIYSGSSAPTSNIGNDGDIYIQTT